MSEPSATELLGNALAAATGELVTKWVVVAESIDDQGVRTLSTIKPEEQATWETLGMLEHVRAMTCNQIEGGPRDE